MSCCVSRPGFSLDLFGFPACFTSRCRDARFTIKNAIAFAVASVCRDFVVSAG